MNSKPKWKPNDHVIACRGNCTFNATIASLPTDKQPWHEVIDDRGHWKEIVASEDDIFPTVGCGWRNGTWTHFDSQAKLVKERNGREIPV